MKGGPPFWAQEWWTRGQQHLSLAAAGLVGLVAFLLWRLRVVAAVMKSFEVYVYDKRGKRLPGPANAFPFGFIWEIKRFRDESIWYKESKKLFQKYGPIVAIRAFTGYTVLVSDPELARVIVTGSADAFPKGALYKNLGLLRGGLVTSNNPKWRQDRRMLNPCFTSKAVEGMYGIYNTHASRLVQHLLSLLQQGDDGSSSRRSSSVVVRAAAKGGEEGEEEVKGEGGGEEGVVVDLGLAVTKMAFDIICHAGFGYPTNSLEQEEAEDDDDITGAINDALREIVKRLTDPIVLLKYLPWRYSKATKATNTLLKLVERIMEEQRRGQREVTGTLVDMMIAAAKEHNLWTTEELLAQCITCHETVSAMLSWTLLELGEHPHVLQRLLAEIDAAWSEGDVTPEHVEARLPYLHCVMKESLRLHPPVTVFSRATVRDIELGEYVIPAGYHVGVSIYALQTSPDNWGPRAEQFVPERWEAEKPLPSPWSYLPFSMGPRNCIGHKFALSEAAVSLCRLLRDVDMTDLLDRPSADLQAVESLTVKPATLRCRIRARTTTTTKTTTTPRPPPPTAAAAAAAEGQEEPAAQ